MHLIKSCFTGPEFEADQNSDEEMKSAVSSEVPAEEVEQNSGIKLNAESVENYIGSSYRIADDSFYGELKFIVEVTDLPEGKFFFQFKKEERVFVGDCEFCYKKKVLKTLCACKRVRYCDPICMKRDLNWHADKCTAR